MNGIRLRCSLLSFLSSADLPPLSKAYNLEKLYVFLGFMRNKGIKIIDNLSTGGVC